MAFGTLFIFLYIGNNHPNWLSYISEGLKPPTRFDGNFNEEITEITMIFYRSRGKLGEPVNDDPQLICPESRPVELPKKTWKIHGIIAGSHCIWTINGLVFVGKSSPEKKFSDFPMIFFRFPLTCLNRSSAVTKGVIVNEIGMRPMITQFQQEYIWPIAPRIPWWDESKKAKVFWN